ncbi:MAG TPA: STAS/SEC14 domain-containing protein [Solirubrobacterales bacterium]
MIERLDGMPDGVIGVRGSGKLTKQDYTDVLEPALKDATGSGEARVVFLLESFDGLEPGALLEDLKTGLRTELSNREAWRRLAVVTDIDWIEKAMELFAWAMPGELKVFDDLDELEEAKSWAAG